MCQPATAQWAVSLTAAGGTVLVMCTHLARSVALRTCSGNTLAQPEVPDKHAFATSGAARGYVGMRGAGHTRPDDHLLNVHIAPWRGG